MEEPAVAVSLRERLASAGLELACPLCRGPLSDSAEAFRCAACAHDYPIVAGIPDFRLLPDRFISFDNDRRKGLRVLEIARSNGGSFEAALDAYWSITPELAPALAARHRVHQVLETEIGGQTLTEAERLAGTAEVGLRTNGCLAQAMTLLDIGCGTAGMLAAAGARFRLAVGVDVAFRWLLVGRLRLREAGLDSPLICANAEHLPFADARFDRVIANDLLEHVVEPSKVLAECRRVVAPRGVCYLAINNRYSLAPEPHVQVWGVGFLARGLQAAYVQSVREHSYQNVRLLSGPELRRLATKAGLRSSRLEPAPLFGRHLGRNFERLVAAYNRLRLQAPWSSLLALVGPRLQILCTQGPAEIPGGRGQASVPGP